MTDASVLLEFIGDIVTDLAAAKATIGVKTVEQRGAGESYQVTAPPGLIVHLDFPTETPDVLADSNPSTLNFEVNLFAVVGGKTNRHDGLLQAMTILQKAHSVLYARTDVSYGKLVLDRQPGQILFNTAQKTIVSLNYVTPFDFL